MNINHLLVVILVAIIVPLVHSSMLYFAEGLKAVHQEQVKHDLQGRRLHHLMVHLSHLTTHTTIDAHLS